MSLYNEKQMYEVWVKAWNEDISLLNKVTASDCVVHQARTDGKASDEKRESQP